MERVQSPPKADSPNTLVAPWIGELTLITALFAILVAHFLHVVEVVTQKTGVPAAAFSREGDRVAIASDAGNAVFDVERCEVEFVIDGRVTALAYSHDGTVLAAGSSRGGIRLLEATTGAEIRSLEGMTDWVVSIRFSADDQKLVAIGHDDHFAVWDVPTGRRVCRIKAGDDHSFAVDFVHGDARVVTGGGRFPGKRTHSVKFWSLENGVLTETWARSEEGYWGSEEYYARSEEYHVEDLTVSKDGRMLVTGLSGARLSVWEIESQRELAVFKAETDHGLKLSKDDTQLLALHYGGVDLCDLKRGTMQTLKVVGHAEAATFADDGTILTLDQFGHVARWNPVSGEQIGQTEGYTLRTRPLSFTILILLGVWVLVWIVWRLAPGLKSLFSPATLFLPAYAGLFVYTGYCAAHAYFHWWSSHSSRGHLGLPLLFVIASLVGWGAFYWSCQVHTRRRPLPMFACVLIAMGGVAFHGMHSLMAMASVG